MDQVLYMGCVFRPPKNFELIELWIRALDFPEFDNQECDVLDERVFATKKTLLL